MRTMWMWALVGCASSGEVVDRVDLSGRFGDEQVEVSGVDLAADGSFVFSTRGHGLWRLEGDEAVRLLSVEALSEAWLPSDLTDVAVLGAGRIALTVPGIGLLYDPSDDSVRQHFCYEPGWGDWEISQQETYSLAFDPTTARLLSQPQTTTDGRADRTDVAEFDRETGESLAWHTLADRKFLASALTAAPEGIVLARGSTLFDYELGDDTPHRRTDLAHLGIERIEGLATAGEDLWVLDATRNEVVRVRGW